MLPHSNDENKNKVNPLYGCDLCCVEPTKMHVTTSQHGTLMVDVSPWLDHFAVKIVNQKKSSFETIDELESDFAPHVGLCFVSHRWKLPARN